MARLADVARKAGVSVATASRALVRPEMVAERTRQRVRDAAAELDFRYHPSAQALATGRSRLLALIVPELTNPFFAPIIAGAQRTAEAAGNDLLVVVGESAERVRALIDRLRDRVDGFLALAPRAPSSVFTSVDVPLVLVDRRMRGVPSVVVDTASGLGAMGAHLASLGHRRIAYLGGPRGSWSDPRRLAELRRGLAHEVVVFGPLPPTFEAGSRIVGELLDSGCTAAVAYNSALFLGLLYRLATLGVRVPEELSVCCADDLAGLGLAVPEATALHVPAEDAGASAVRTLLGLVEGRSPQPRHQLVGVDLVVGRTTAVPG
ncbi:LacI family transcriptional regulator [Saccharopolyspora sp. K220]|uniref:LacI family DNA-binding transcriptional regulator n=1 Tax=Saccharopolyspora soli TaxID=2926618 RepID=UPI001F5757AB|nr:LacI family DNA-binding transcriptional regulator [Saccharopolyspora soli]MCI2423664.1 LacI family transcriptional regulator [Saccharopolyspora soli]